ncbi:MAG TPA: hypothetical protein VIM73_16190, partial [Polyangiaceae bacterium]
LLASADSSFERRSDVAGVDLVGWGYAGPQSLRAAVDQALSMAHLTLSQVDKVFGIDRTGQWAPIAEAAGFQTPIVDVTAALGNATSVSSVLSAVQAFTALRGGEIRCALVISAAGTAVTSALVLTRTQETSNAN